MPLLQLPQHILQQIVADTVNISLPHQAWPLRLVCKKFDQELLHAVFDRDETTLLDAIVNRETPFYSNVGRFRCLRGFLLRHNHRAQQFTLWEQLDAAVTILTDHVPKEVTSTTPIKQLPSPDRFMKVVSTNSQIASHENAIAMVCDAVISFLGDEITLLDLFDWSWYNGDLTWENLEDKKTEFWLLVVAARRHDLELCHTALERLRNRKNDLDTGVWIDNLADALRIPARQGFKEMIELILAQDGMQTEHIARRGRNREHNSIEVAADAAQLDIVQFFISRGVDLLHNQRDYSKAFSLAIRSSTEKPTREAFIELFMSLTQEWRSSEVTAGIIEAICTHGDVETVKMVVEKFEASPDDQAQHQWQWISFTHPNAVLVEAAKSKNTTLVQYVIENKKRLLSLLEDSFTTDKVLESLETSIEQKHPEVLAELFKQDLPETIMKERLFTYAAITSDVKTLELLVKDVNLSQKFDEDSPYWDYYLENSRLAGKMYQVGSDCTPYLQERDLLSLGTMCLVLAIKAGEVDIARWFLEQGIRLGRRYVEYSRWAFMKTSSLILTDESLLGGKGYIFGFTLKFRRPVGIKRMLEGGSCVLSPTFIFTRGRSPQQIQAAIDKGKKPTKRTNFLDKFRWTVQRADSDSFDGARVVFGIEVPELSYMNIEQDQYDRDKFAEMCDLLYDHRHPNIYIDFRWHGSA